MTATFIFPLYSPAPASPSFPAPSPSGTMVSGSWGLSGYGVGPWGGSTVPAVSTDIDATPIRENLVRVAFTTAVFVTGLFNLKDALNPIHYTIENGQGTGIDDLEVRTVNVIRVQKVVGTDRALDLFTDRPLSHYPCIYTLRCNNIRDSSGVIFINTSSVLFYGLQSTFEKPVPSMFAPGGTRDFANPSTKGALFDPLPEINDANLGTFPYGDDGDYGHDEGIENLRKRVIRRGVVKPGGFVWLPKYGLGLKLEAKKLNNSSRRERIRATYEAQVLEEPDVRRAKVSFRFLPSTPGILWLLIRVLTTTNRAFKFDVPILVG